MRPQLRPRAHAPPCAHCTAPAAPRPLRRAHARVRLRPAQMAIGAFLLTLKLTGKTGLGLAAMCAGFLVNIAIVLSGPDYAGDKAGLAFWAVLQATLGGLAFMNEK